MNPNKIIIHCSDSPTGNAHVINSWHKLRGFDEIGYHFVINNGVTLPCLDGSIEVGRKLTKMGAHVRGHNRDSIGICLIGKNNFSLRQLASLQTLCEQLCSKYHIKEILGHYELDSKKTCPNIDMDWLRNLIKP